MTATDECLPNDTKELDTLLNERGQEHRVWPSGMVVWHDERTVYEYEPAKNHHDEYWGGILRMTMRHLTPEQVIETTLGRRKCKNVHEPPKDTTFWPTPHFKCSVCGKTHVSTDYVYFCPNCGRKVVGE